MLQFKMEKYFKLKSIQKLMSSLTRVQVEKVYSPNPKKVEETTNFVLMTEKQVESTLKNYEFKAREKLQPVPLLEPRKECEVIISKNGDLSKCVLRRHVFVNISSNYSNRDRIITIRETNGTLRTANWAERDRWNQSFFPILGRRVVPPKVFENEQLELMLAQRRYTELLDRAGLQFEPDNPEYIRVVQRTFNAVDKNKDYNNLFSTRYYSSFVFYLAYLKKIDDILMYALKSYSLGSAHGANIVRIFHLIHASSPSAIQVKKKNLTKDIQILLCYALKDSSSRVLYNLIQIEKDKKTEDNKLRPNDDRGDAVKRGKFLPHNLGKEAKIANND